MQQRAVKSTFSEPPRDDCHVLRHQLALRPSDQLHALTPHVRISEASYTAQEQG